MRFRYKKFLIRLWRIIYKTIRTFNMHGGVENAGYLSFSLLFAIFPFMIFFTLIIGWLGQGEIVNILMQAMENHLPDQITKAIVPVIDSVINVPHGSILSLATLTLLWSASGMAQTIRGVLNKAYRIRPTHSYLRGRIVSILKFLLMVIFIVALIFTTIILPKILDFISIIAPIQYNSFGILTLLRPLLLIVFLFIFIEFVYFVMPSKRKMALHDVLWGNILTITGWIVSGKALTFYLSKMAKFDVVYGSFAGIIITLFFFNIMAMIFIFGAEFNYHVKDMFARKGQKNLMN